MGKISIITKEQKIILGLISKTDALRENFYFTGGTVLSEFYLHHRYSDDLDFFSEKKLDQELIFYLISLWSKNYNFTFSSRFVEVVYRFEFSFSSGANLKLDFGYYPHKRIEKGTIYQGLNIDSLRDIATNKLLTVNQRTDIKDFVDLYFLLKQHFTVWDLTYSCQTKFRSVDLDILLLAQDFLKVDDFQTLPRMLKPLTLAKLRNYFRAKATEVGRKVTVR